jgi:hypothetical protein
MTDSESFIFEIILSQKSIISLLKLNSHQILFWFNVFIDNMRDLINVFKINVENIKRIFSDVHINFNC